MTVGTPYKIERKDAPTTAKLKGVKMETESLIERIKELPPEKITEVEDFVEFLHQRTAQQERMNGESARATKLAAIAASMKANTFAGDPPRFSREELHERR